MRSEGQADVEWRLFAWVAALTALTVCLIMLGTDAAFHFDVYPIDGTLHFFNPLRRIGLGQRGGTDFQVFHGLGLPYAVYPLFDLLGGDLFVAESVRQLLVPLTLVITYLAVFGSLTRSTEGAIRLTTLAVLGTIAFKLTTLLIPGGSVLGIRTGLPLVFIAVIATSWRSPARVLAEGALLGLTVLLSTEQGVAIAAAYCVVSIVRAVSSRQWRVEARRMAIVSGVAAMTFVGGLTAIGGVRGMRQALVYNFGAVAQDQFWYFGSPPTAFLFSWTQFVAQPSVTLVLIAGFANAGWWLRKLATAPDRDSAKILALTTLSVYGPLSATPIVAMWVGGYVQGLSRVLIITALTAADAFASRRQARGDSSGTTRWWPELAAAALIAVALARQPAAMLDLVRAPWHMASSHLLRGDRPSFSDSWRETVSIADSVLARHRTPAHPAPLIWSTYSGIVEAANDVTNPSFDYMIDALGRDNRDAYLATFRGAQPAIVQTVDPRFTAYEEWLEATSWDFYRELLLNYRVAAVGPWSIFWERDPRPGMKAPVVARWDSSGARQPPGFTIRGLRKGEVLLLEAEVEYRLANPWRHVPLFGRMPRFFIGISGAMNTIPVPLPPYRSSVRFPIVTGGRESITLRPQVMSLLPGARLAVSSITIRGIPIDSTREPWLATRVEAGLRPLKRD